MGRTYANVSTLILFPPNPRCLAWKGPQERDKSLVNEGLPAGLREEGLLQGLGTCGCQEGREMGLNGKTTDTASLGRAAWGASPY